MPIPLVYELHIEDTLPFPAIKFHHEWIHVGRLPYAIYRCAAHQHHDMIEPVNPQELVLQRFQLWYIRSAKQDDIYGASNIVLPCPGS